MSKPRKPAGLGIAGSALWQRLTARVEIVFSTTELEALALACRQADDVARLERLLAEQGPVIVGSKGQPRLSGVLTELRLQRVALVRLLGELALPDVQAGEVVGLTPRQRKARKAADVRWARAASKRAAGGSRRGSVGGK